jgi:hypothetical protein
LNRDVRAIPSGLAGQISQKSGHLEEGGLTKCRLTRPPNGWMSGISRTVGEEGRAGGVNIGGWAAEKPFLETICRSVLKALFGPLNCWRDMVPFFALNLVA